MPIIWFENKIAENILGDILLHRGEKRVEVKDLNLNHSH